MSAANSITDHIGNEFNSIQAMLIYWEITPGTYYARRRKGLNMKEILETPCRKHSVADHLGNQYVSMLDMCHAYNISVDAVYWRLRHGWTLTDALTTPISREHRSESTIISDHLGNRYASKSDMCAHYHVSRALFEYRIKHNWPLEKALRP